jgi:hypothetical protein
LICAAVFDVGFISACHSRESGNSAREAPLKKETGEERRAHLFTMAM